MSLLAEGTLAVKVKAGAAQEPKKSRRKDRNQYRLHASDGAREVAYTFLMPPWRTGFIAERTTYEGDFDYSSRLLESDDGNSAVWRSPAPQGGAAEHADQLIMDGKLVLGETGEGVDGGVDDLSDPFKVSARFYAGRGERHGWLCCEEWWFRAFADVARQLLHAQGKEAFYAPSHTVSLVPLLLRAFTHGSARAVAFTRPARAPLTHFFRSLRSAPRLVFRRPRATWPRWSWRTSRA